MVTYQEFKDMLSDRLLDVTDPELVLFVNRLMVYTDDLIAAGITPPAPPPVLPDIEPDSKGDPIIS